MGVCWNGNAPAVRCALRMLQRVALASAGARVLFGGRSRGNLLVMAGLVGGALYMTSISDEGVDALTGFDVQLGSFITKGFGPKTTNDEDMFAGLNQSVAYLSKEDMIVQQIECGDAVVVRVVPPSSKTEDGDDTVESALDRLSLRDRPPSEGIGALAGDGTHSVIALAWQHPKASKGTINFSLLLRRAFRIKNTGTKSAGFAPGTRIVVQKISSSAVRPAKVLTLAFHVSGKKGGRRERIHVPKGYPRYVCQLLGGRLLTVGTPISLSVLGVIHRCTVHAIRAEDANRAAAESEPSVPIFRVMPYTRVQFTDPGGDFGKEARGAADRFKAIGGLQTQIATIRKMIELPLHQPEVFVQIGIRPPKGVLLYGPPGTGKTMIARAVSEDADASFFVINGPELLSKYVGESEGALANVFERAVEEQPSVIFIDEIDALCPRRDGRTSEGGHSGVEEVDKRMVSTLLTLMDGAGTAENARIMVIAATNRPDAIDQALRRPGRFDREIEIGIPNMESRGEILQCLLENLPNNVSLEQIKSLASVTHGFVGADLKALCQEASVSALLRLDPDNHDASQYQVQMQDMEKGLTMVKPSALRELAIDIPSVRWTDIGGQELAKQRLQEAVEWPLKHPELFEEMGIRPSKGVLLYGPPGCSKTMMAKAVATESSMNFIAVKGPELLSQWVGDSEKAIRDLFKKARAAAPTVVFFDEIDALASKRGAGGGGGSKVIDRVLSQLLVELDGVVDVSNQVVLLAATNRPDMLDPALLRPGRIDYLVHVTLPEIEARRDILRIHLRETPIDQSEETVTLVNYVAEQCEGYSGAELAAVCQEAAFCALEENIDAVCVRTSHFDAALSRVKPQTSSDMLAFYETFAKSVKGRE